MFGIGKVIQNVLNEHNLGELAGQLATGSMAELRQSIEALGESGKISDVGRLLDDLSGQLQTSLGAAADAASHLADPAEEEERATLSDAARQIGSAVRETGESIGTVGATTGAALSAQAAANAEPVAVPAEAEVLPHEATHALQGVAIDEDDGVIATEADAVAAPAETVQVHAGDDDQNDD